MKAHTIILGAGATIAAIPNGDKNGKISSVMNGMMQKLKLQELLVRANIHTKSDNLEDIYSELYMRPECKNIVFELENRIYQYFVSLELPDEPTIYDYLILSLTQKDVIATFNWDPLLLQAYVRCHSITNNLPHILCLHGNVSMGFCVEHKEYGMTNAICPICKRHLQPTKILYPVAEKDYDSDVYIKECWDAIELIIENSYMLTIFGYSAPSSDKKAVALFKKAWGNLEQRQLEEVSVIDIINENLMLNKWKDFIYTHHYRYTDNFFDSYLGVFPRRSCEMTFASFQLNVWADNSKGFHSGMTWDEIKEILCPLFQEEFDTPESENYPIHYAHKNAFM